MLCYVMYQKTRKGYPCQPARSTQAENSRHFLLSVSCQDFKVIKSVVLQNITAINNASTKVHDVVFVFVTKGII